MIAWLQRRPCHQHHSSRNISRANNHHQSRESRPSEQLRGIFPVKRRCTWHGARFFNIFLLCTWLFVTAGGGGHSTFRKKSRVILFLFVVFLFYWTSNNPPQDVYGRTLLSTLSRITRLATLPPCCRATAPMMANTAPAMTGSRPEPTWFSGWWEGGGGNVG